MKKSSVKILLEALIAIFCLLLGAFIGVFLDRSGYLGGGMDCVLCLFA